MSSKALQYIGEDLETIAEEKLPPTFFDIDQRLNIVELNETLRWFIPGTLSAPSSPLSFLWPFPAKNISVALAVLTAPAAPGIDVDIEANGSDIFGLPNGPRIAAGQKFGAFKSALLVTSFAVGDQMKILIDQVGGGPAGADLSVIIRSEKT